MRYRPEIDGVRAFAVVAVVAYHAGVPGFGGGFVGVDVFFVISGYLITGLLVAERTSTGRLSLGGFYARRARRLLPVAALVTVVTVVVGWWVLPRIARGDLSADAFATSTYTINLRLAAQHLDYLRTDLAPSSFQQFWSLAVEEQFYLVWPLVLLAALRGAAPRRRATIAVAAVVAVSFVVNLWWTDVAPEWAFFSLPARAWELGAGALLALVWARVEGVDERIRAGAQLVGLVAIAGAVVTLGDVPAWPGGWALVPTVATLLVLSGPARPRSPLAHPLLVAVGVRSYSWYLWHWPAMVFVAVALDRELGGWPAVAVGVATLGLAHLTYTRVEQPVRRAPRLVASPRASVALGLALTVTLAAGFAVLHTRRGEVVGPGVAVDEATPAPIDGARLDRAALTEAVPANLTPSLDDALDDAPQVFRDGCNGDLGTTPVDDDAVRRCTYGDPAGTTTVVLVGDSHAAQWVPALTSLAEAQGLRLVVLTKSACPIADLSVDNQFLGRPYDECDEWRDEVVARLPTMRPDLIVTTSTNHYTARAPDGAAADATTWSAALTRTLRSLAAAGPTVFLGDTPYPAGDVPACLAEHLSSASACTLGRGQVPFDYARVEAQAAADAGVALVPTVDLACGPLRCPVIVGRHLVYRDASHLATPYVRRLAPQFGALLDAAAGRSGTEVRLVAGGGPGAGGPSG